MKTETTIMITMLVMLAAADSALAHPGSGIAVDREGQVYFTQTNGKGTWKVSPMGELAMISDLRYHWLDIDLEGHFSPSSGSRQTQNIFTAKIKRCVATLGRARFSRCNLFSLGLMLPTSPA